MSDTGASDNSDPLDTAPAFTELVPVGEANMDNELQCDSFLCNFAFAILW